MSVIGRRFSVGDIVSYRADLEASRNDRGDGHSLFVVKEVDLKFSDAAGTYPGQQIVRIVPLDPLRLGSRQRASFTELSRNLVLGDVLRVARAIQELHTIAMRMVGASVQTTGSKG